MATINKRTFMPTAALINGVACGGTTTTRIDAGYESFVRSTPDGLMLPVVDRDTQYVRGRVQIEDWIEAFQLILGTVDSLVFYERKSGTAPATGYIKHTLLHPVIHRVRLAVTKGGWATVAFDFECKFPSEAATINTVWAITDAQAAPAYVAAARGGWRIASAAHGTVSIAHLMSLSFDLAMPVLKACNDADLGYTAVDCAPEMGMTASGDIGFQDATVTGSTLAMNTLLLAAPAGLTATVLQSGGATAKVITIARTQFGSGQASGSREFTGFTLPFEVSNNPALPLTLAGDNKIITIADAA